MALFLIIALVFALYLKTLNYNYVIDDNVRREGYLYDVPLESPGEAFFNTRPSRMYRLFMISMHCVNVSIIYMLWGWGPALLFAVHPIGVWGTAWVTGNYYATTAYFTLIAFYILNTFPNVWGAIAAIPIYMAALNSTVCAINFPFIFLFTSTPWGLAMALPLIGFLNGKKFKTGIKIRLRFHMNKKVDASFTWRRLILMTKVMARYIYLAFVPYKLGFFSPFGTDLRDDQEKYDRIHSMNKEFWYSLLLCVTVGVVGLIIHPQGTIWFFVLMSLHTQWNLTGQFFAQRYLYLPIVGLCVVFGTVLQAYPLLMAIVATILVVRTWQYIPAWRSQEFMWKNDMETYPGCAKAYSNVAQYYMNKDLKKLPSYMVNYCSYLMTKALYMLPDAWEIHMNFAYLLAQLGQLEATLHHTNKAIECLEPLGGVPEPLMKLKDQKIRVEEAIQNIKDKQRASLVNSFTPKNQGGRDGKRKKEEGISAGVKSNGDRESERREAISGVRSQGS